MILQNDNEIYNRQLKRFKKYINIILSNGFNASLIERSVEIETFNFHCNPDMFRSFNDELKHYIAGEPFDLNYFFKFSAQAEEDLVETDTMFNKFALQNSMQNGRIDLIRKKAFDEILKAYSEKDKSNSIRGWRKDTIKSVWEKYYKKDLERKTQKEKTKHYNAFKGAFYHFKRNSGKGFAAKHEYAIEKFDDDEKFKQMTTECYEELEGIYLFEIQKMMCYIWDKYYYKACLDSTELQQFKSWKHLTRLIIHLLEKGTIPFWQKMLKDIRTKTPRL